MSAKEPQRVVRAAGVARAVGRNVAGQSAARVLSVGLSIAVTALLTRHLGVAGFGSFVSAIASISLFSFFFDWGTQTMLVRELADPGVERERVVAKALALRCALSLPTVVLVAVFLLVLYRGQPQVRLAGLILLVTIPLGELLCQGVHGVRASASVEFVVSG